MSNAQETVAHQEAIWDHFQNEGKRSFDGSRARLAHLARVAARVSPKGSAADVLDVGVGAGQFAEASLALGLTVSCLDPNERAIAALRERLALGDRARVGTSAEMPFESETFDVVCLSEVLEHLADDVLERTLDEVRRVLRPGGAFLGTVPAREDLELSTAVCPDCGKSFHRWGHVRSFSAASLSELLGRAFTVEHLSSRPFPNWATLNWKGKTSGLLKLGLARLGVHGTGECFVFVGRRGS